MTDSSVLFPSEGIQAQPIEEGALILDTRSGDVYQLNHIGVEVWSQICSGATIGAIVDVIAARYTIPREQAERDLRNLIAALTKADLVSAKKPVGREP